MDFYIVQLLVFFSEGGGLSFICQKKGKLVDQILFNIRFENICSYSQKEALGVEVNRGWENTKMLLITMDFTESGRKTELQIINWQKLIILQRNH